LEQKKDFIKMSKEKNKEKLILESAVSLFKSKGYEATRMEDVAKKAGISKGLTYFYFKNKEDLFMALTKKAFDQFKDEFKETAKSEEKNGLSLILELVKRIWNFSAEQPVYYQAILNFLDVLKKYNDPVLKAEINPLILDSVHFQKLLEMQLEPVRIGVQLISQGIKDGSIRSELHPEITFYTIWSMVIGFEKMRGPIEYEKKETKISPEVWKSGYLKLIQDMLKRSIQSSKPQAIQASLF
jgi:AcrR family transcriptional regulator